MEQQAILQNKLDELTREQLLVKSQLDRERLVTITGNLIDTITSPKFIENMRQFRERAAKGASFEEAGDLMSLESLRAAGANIPKDFRLTSRVFEDLKTGFRVEIKPPRPIDAEIDIGGPGPVAWGACAGGGAATVCGCAGGST